MLPMVEAMNARTEAARILQATRWYPTVALAIVTAGAIGALAAVAMVAVWVLLVGEGVKRTA
ncbi:hypothetical protein PCA_08650 [Rhodanobacter sp. PCA2]|nr:hypothetical protein [Rhodanobacter sp. PCA2]